MITYEATHHPRESRFDGVTRLHKASDRFQELQKRLDLEPSSLLPSEIAEVLAVAFLLNPERLIWGSSAKEEVACFLGEPLENANLNGYAVLALVMGVVMGTYRVM